MRDRYGGRMGGNQAKDRRRQVSSNCCSRLTMNVADLRRNPDFRPSIPQGSVREAVLLPLRDERDNCSALMDAIPDDLPSTVDQTFAACPQFRIVVIGSVVSFSSPVSVGLISRQSGVGKSSLVSSVFNISLSSRRIDVAHDRAGRADIEYAHSSHENPRFILHDSMGFEHGATEQWGIVERFLRRRVSNPYLHERVHAIWLCIETPRTGTRIMQTGDENLMTLAKELQIPVIAVFTKFDTLVIEHFRLLRQNIPHATRKNAAKNDAAAIFNERIQGFRLSMQVPCVKVSTMKDYRQETLLELTNITQETLHHVEGELWIPWAAAQQISGRQKVDLSISEGSKRYWIDWTTVTVFQGHRLRDCIARIHYDILKVWNFNDPHSLLSGKYFKEKMVQLAAPLFDGLPENTGVQQSITGYSGAVTIATAVAPGAGQVVGAFGAVALFAQTLCGTYQKAPSTARYLGAYIVGLILILHHLFLETLSVEPPRALTKDNISCALEGYRSIESARVHGRIQSVPLAMLTARFELTIADIIRENLR